MQEQAKSVYKTLTWLLLIVVVGMYALHLWYSGVLKNNLAAEKRSVAEHAQSLQQTKANLAQEVQTEAGLRSEIQTLTGRITATTQANQAIQRDMDALKQQHADALAAAQTKASDTLAAEQKKAAEAYAKLQGRLEQATKEVAAMSSDITQLKQAQVDATASHEAQLNTLKQAQAAKLNEVEGRFKDRIAALQTTLKGTDPERAALFASFEERIQHYATTIDDLETAKGDLNDQLTAAKQTIGEGVKALAQVNDQLQASQTELTQTRGELSQLQTQHNTAMEKATQELATLQAKHDTAMKKAAAERADLAHQHTAAMDAAAKQRADLETAHAAALDKAAKQQADLLAQHAAAMEAAAKERADLEATHASTLKQAAKDTAALKTRLESELAQTKADDATKIEQANQRIEALTDSLATQTAALDAQIADSKKRISTLEATLSSERDQATAALAAAKKSYVDAMTHQHDLLVKVSALGGKETDQGLLLTLAEADLRFPIARSTLPAGDLPSLDRVAALMTEFPKLTARIEGHTDASGREETNLALSQERADAVKQALVERGVAAERMEAVGMGEAHPIADNATKAGSRQNRRVEVYVIEPTQ